MFLKIRFQKKSHHYTDEICKFHGKIERQQSECCVCMCVQLLDKIRTIFYIMRVLVIIVMMKEKKRNFLICTDNLTSENRISESSNHVKDSQQ